ncbi:hypothetical protein Misp01_67250 [Microtetraspora sp. NBRC 13810]|uniref:hypothetical protein n=1 Tax=Microtetraspora sp. NBRC 13810 TaxID=3030990 RepID=UPI0024A5DB10|nr:hypothetical protein [Microtetraspora sp. NBRC 13810]GLW11597.1 hypothetical protein Misp01_67250 [Microtetraspora sp. NBRC 13810]
MSDACCAPDAPAATTSSDTETAAVLQLVGAPQAPANRTLLPIATGAGAGDRDKIRGGSTRDCTDGCCSPAAKESR